VKISSGRPCRRSSTLGAGIRVDGLLLGRRPPGVRTPGPWWCKHRDRRGAYLESEAMATKQTSKQRPTRRDFNFPRAREAISISPVATGTSRLTPERSMFDENRHAGSGRPVGLSEPRLRRHEVNFRCQRVLTRTLEPPPATQGSRRQGVMLSRYDPAFTKSFFSAPADPMFSSTQGAPTNRPARRRLAQQGRRAQPAVAEAVAAA
jgi:hypothetical protein